MKEPDDESGTLIDVAKHQSCVQHQVWDKMLRIIQYCKQSFILWPYRIANDCVVQIFCHWPIYFTYQCYSTDSNDGIDGK